MTVGADVYVVPEEWAPAGMLRHLNARQVTPRLNINGQSPDVDAEWNESLRRTLLGLALPRRTGAGIRSYKPSTWAGVAPIVIKMANWSAEHRPSPTGLWSHLTGSDWKELITGISLYASTRSKARLIVRHLVDLGSRGVIVDFPRVADESHDAENGPVPEKARQGEPVAERPVRPENKTYQPLPDEFVTELISRAMWFYDHLAPQIIACWKQLRIAQKSAAEKGRRVSHPATTAECRAIVAAFDWRNSMGNDVSALPWPINVVESRRKIRICSWPPRDGTAINLMITLLQALNYCVTNFCTGARSGEILDASDRSFDLDGERRFKSRTFKLIDPVGGQERDWPLHPVAQTALALQREIAIEVRPQAAEHLWVLLHDGNEPAGSPLRNITEPVCDAVTRLSLDHLTGEARPHVHRWRHTVARLVALSVVSAPQVLMDLFGHRDLEMTLRYMLSSPDIAEEVMRVAKEAAYAVAEEAVRDAEDGVASGAAASPLHDSLETLKMKRGEEHLDAGSIREAIDILSFNGKFWQMIRPGVLCTKAPWQSGPCTQGRGQPNPAACRVDCDNRLETARAKSHCDEAIAMLLKEHAAAVDQEMVAAEIEGQILANLKRWTDVRERYLAESDVARQIWAGRNVAPKTA